MIKDTLTYDIVGSFLRPAEIKEARKAYKDGKITKEELNTLNWLPADIDAVNYLKENM